MQRWDAMPNVEWSLAGCWISKWRSGLKAMRSCWVTGSCGRTWRYGEGYTLLKRVVKRMSFDEDHRPSDRESLIYQTAIF
jgi:hypothetical protein